MLWIIASGVIYSAVVKALPCRRVFTLYNIQHFFFTYSWHLIDEMQMLCFSKKKVVIFFSKNLMQHFLF